MTSCAAFHRATSTACRLTGEHQRTEDGRVVHAGTTNTVLGTPIIYRWADDNGSLLNYEPAPICGSVHRSFGYVCEQPDLGHETVDGVTDEHLVHRMTVPGAVYRWTYDNGIVETTYPAPTREG